MNLCIRNRIFGTFPYFIHGPGLKSNASPLFPSIAKLALTRTCDAIMPSNLSIITWNSEPIKGLLERCLDNFHYPYLTLGKKHQKDWVNILKLPLIIEALQSIPTEYVIGADCWDVVLARPITDILDTFLALQTKLVFNGELFLCPHKVGTITDTWYREQLAASTAGPFCFLNSGLWMGHREFCIQFFQTCMDFDVCPLIQRKQLEWHAIKSDQVKTHGAFGKYTGQVTMDCKCQLFQNLAFVDSTMVEHVQPTIL